MENSALTIKQQAINASISRGNATDDIKSASNDIVTNIKKLLGLTACGNNGEAIIRDTITPLITPDTQVYQQLERLILVDAYGAQMVPSLVLMLHEYSSASEKKVRLLSKTTHFN